MISQFKPHLVLAAYAAINVVLTAVCMGGGKLGMYAMFGTFFFMSVMFPTIFALGIRPWPRAQTPGHNRLSVFRPA